MLHVVVDVLVASALEETQRGRSDVELRNLVLLDHVPVAREVRVCGRALEHHRRRTQQQGRVDDISVAGDPADVTTAEEAVVLVDVEHILAGGSGTHQITGGRVHDTLRLARGTRGVKQEERIFRVDGLRSQVVGELRNLLVPPEVSALGPRHLGACALEHDDVAHVGTLLKGLIDDALGANDFATAAALVGGDDDLGIGIQHAVPQRVRREAREDDRVHGTDTNAGQECHEGFRDHRQVDRDGVTLAHTEGLQHPGELRDLAQQLAVGDGAALTGLIGLVDDGRLVGVLDGMAVDAVIGGVQTATKEPGVVAMLK